MQHSSSGDTISGSSTINSCFQSKFLLSFLIPGQSKSRFSVFLEHRFLINNFKMRAKSKTGIVTLHVKVRKFVYLDLISHQFMYLTIKPLHVRFLHLNNQPLSIWPLLASLLVTISKQNRKQIYDNLIMFLQLSVLKLMQRT